MVHEFEEVFLMPHGEEAMMVWYIMTITRICTT